MPLMQSGDAQIYYELVGSGPPLVVTSGLGTGPAARAHLVAGLAERYTVMTYDQRGTGRSSLGRQGQPIEELAEDIVALMDDAGFKSAHLVGLSTGTGKATVVAARHPSRVETLVLAAPWSHGDQLLNIIQHTRIAAASSMPADLYTHFNALLLYPPEYRRAHAVRFNAAAQDAMRRKPDSVSLAARLEAILRFDARPLYPEIGHPTLVLGARDDLVFCYWFAEEAARAIPNARISLTNHGGHMFPETRTEWFLEEVHSFLKGTR